LALQDVNHQIQGTTIALGSQMIAFQKDLGAYTGQVAGQHLQEIGCRYVLVGHSEQRQYFGVDDALVAHQTRTALAHQLIPIICIGETHEQRQAGQTDQVLVSQLEAILSDIQVRADQIVIAYEPRWAISAVSGGIPCLPEEADHAHQLIRHTLQEFKIEESVKTSIIYGGSIDDKNMKSFLELDSVDGALIGSASTKPESLKRIVQELEDQLC